MLRNTDIDVVTPLWQREREGLLRRFIDLGFEAVLSCVKPPLDGRWLGRRLDGGAIEELLRLSDSERIDPSSEQGEYHTLVVDGPGYQQRLRLQTTGTMEYQDLIYLEIAGVGLEGKQAGQGS